MCGIFGFYLQNSIDDNKLEKAKQALKLISHRGPDSSNWYFDKSKGIFLGHTRLSIIDLSTINSQPLIRDKKVLIYNGEIYNYKKIKNELIKKNHFFKTKGDTEVLYKILMDLNFTNLRMIDGMFAFAYFHNQKLFLSRDIYGEKPLYFYKTNEGVYFSSEQKILIQFCQIDKQINDKSINEFLNFGYNFKHKFYNIDEVKQGTVLTIEKGIIKSEFNYSSIPKINKKNKYRNIKELNIKKIKNIILESLKDRLNADTPIGLLLSSGNDSILIATLLKKELNYDIQTATYAFANQNYDEYKFVNEFCNINNIQNTKITYQSRTNIFRDLLDIYDVPNDNLTALNIFRISKEMRKNFKVALTGLGADEIFYGYNKHYFAYRNNFILSNLKLKYLAKFFKSIDIGFIKKYNYYNYENFIEILLALKNNPYFNNKLLNNKFLYEQYHEILNNNDNNDLLSFFINFYNYYDLNFSIIQSVDRGSMKAGVELRTPYLNKTLHNYISKFNPRDIMKFGNKWIQKTILYEYLPEKFIQKIKKGFINPPENSHNLILDEFNNSKEVNYINNNYKTDNRWNKLIVRKNILQNFI